MPKVALTAKRAEYFAKLGMFKEAAEVAMREKDPELLLKIRNSSTNRDAIGYYDAVLAGFQQKK